VARIHWWIMWSIATGEFQIENNRCWAFHWFRTRWFGGRGWIGFRIVGFHRKNCPDLGSGECFTRISDLINTAARLRIYLIFWLVSRILLQIWADRWICIPQFPPPPAPRLDRLKKASHVPSLQVHYKWKQICKQRVHRYMFMFSNQSRVNDNYRRLDQLNKSHGGYVGIPDKRV
jgi:hypothetical protein